MDNYIFCECGSKIKYNKYYYEKHKETLKHLNYSRYIKGCKRYEEYKRNEILKELNKEEEEKLILDINNIN